MRKSKLITLLKIFSKEEMKDFEKFIASPYFNNGRNFKPFYKILKKYYPDFESPELTEENIFKELYPNKVFETKKSSVTTRVLFSQMTALAEKFLIYDHIEKQDYHLAERELANVLKDRCLYDYALQIVKKSQAKLKFRETDKYIIYERMCLNELLFMIYSGMNQQPIGMKCLRFNPLYLVAITFDRIGSLLNNKIGLATNDNEKGNTEILFNIVESIDPVLFENICEDDGLGAKDSVLMNYYMCLIRKDKKAELFNKIVDFYYNNFKSISKTYKWKYFIDIHNIGYALAHTMDYEFFGNTTSKLSTFVLTNGIYTANKDNHLPVIAFEYIFNFKFVFFKIEQLKEFIEIYSVKVQPTKIDEAKNYAYAFYYFKKKEFNKSLEYLSKLFPNSWKKNILHKLKIAVLYEMRFYQDAYYSIDTYEHFARNNKNVSQGIRKAGLNFTNAIKNLIKAKTNSAVNELDLKKIIDENKNSHFGFWIKEKVEELV